MVKSLYHVRGLVVLPNGNYFVADSALDAVDMYNLLIMSRNKKFNDDKPLSTERDVSFKMFVYIK